MDGKIDSLAHGQRLNAFLDVARSRFQTGSMEGGPGMEITIRVRYFTQNGIHRARSKKKMQLRYV